MLQNSVFNNKKYRISGTKKNISRSRKMQENDQLIETNPYIGEKMALRAKN